MEAGASVERDVVRPAASLLPRASNRAGAAAGTDPGDLVIVFLDDQAEMRRVL